MHLLGIQRLPNYVFPISYAHFIQSYHCRILMSSYHLPAHDIMLCTDFRINTHILNMTYKVWQGLALPASPVLCYTILHFQSNRIGLLLISHIYIVLPFSALGFLVFYLHKCSHSYMTSAHRSDLSSLLI